ncbi:MAG TPA: glutathione S-transferase N-terminal domain-containing protein [Bacillota bacterium]|nr:glutathione S-transferase N-terminal domain-containing protein [Bacillota bacterium]
MILLYNLDHCPYCRKVREVLSELALDYELVEVPKERDARNEVFAASGQYFVPVLIDGDIIIADDDEKAITYLRDKYANQ